MITLWDSNQGTPHYEEQDPFYYMAFILADRIHGSRVKQRYGESGKKRFHPTAERIVRGS